MKPNNDVADLRRRLTENMRIVGLDYAENTSESHIVDLRTISFSFGILDRGRPFKESLNHITESILARSASIQVSKLAAACAYYLCEEVLGAYKIMRDGQSPPELTAFARRCDLVTGGDEVMRLVILWLSLQGRFRDAKPEIIAAIARSISSFCSSPRPDSGNLTLSDALSIAAYACLETGQSELAARLAEQLSELAESEGYSAIAEMIRTPTVTAGTDENYFKAINEAIEIAENLPSDDPAKEIANALAEGKRREWSSVDDASRSPSARGFGDGIGLLRARDFGEAAAAFDHAAGQSPGNAEDAMYIARSAVLALLCRWRTFYDSYDYPSSEVDSALCSLTSHNFAAARDYVDCSVLLQRVLRYCAARSDDQSYAWLAARVADLRGEFSAGCAVGSNRISQQTDDMASRELAVKDLLSGMIDLPSEESLRVIASGMTVVWVSVVISDDEPVILSVFLRPGDHYPRLNFTTVRSAEGRQLLEDATNTNLQYAPDGASAAIATLRMWIFRQEIDPRWPLMIIPDRRLWCLPWEAVAPAEVRAVTIAPSASASSRLAGCSRARVPVIAGVFDPKLEGAEAELSALKKLHAQNRIILRRARSLAELRALLADGGIDLLTIAVHGTSHDGFEYRLLFPDSPASPAGMLNLRLPPIVVLGCCWSARLGKKADSIATALSCLAVGASTVVGALWDVDDAVAGEILSSAYPDFASGINLSEAIRVAYLKTSAGRVDGAALGVLGLP
ncbi:MAG: CHAT domain-containing protein [Streptosporangiaceae bacterium]